MRAERSRAIPIAVGALVAALIVGGCSKDEQDPAKARRDRIEARLQQSFSAKQAGCIVDDLDDSVLRALDRKADLAADSAAEAQYSAAVAACVTGESPTTTRPPTTVAPTTTAHG